MKTQPKNLTRQNQHYHGLFLDLAYADRLTYLVFAWETARSWCFATFSVEAGFIW